MQHPRAKHRIHQGLALVVAGFLTACSAAAPVARDDGPIASAEYLIGPGDVLNVFVYRSPELGAADLPVRPDGRLSLPLVPDITAAGQTPTQLARSIEGRLREFVRDPNVTVMVRSFTGPSDRQVRIIGEAAQPLALPYRDGMTVLDAMIASRGLTRFAAGNRARIVRVADGSAGARPRTIPLRLADLLNDGDVAQDMALRPGDTIVIPTGWF